MTIRRFATTLTVSAASTLLIAGCTSDATTETVAAGASGTVSTATSEVWDSSELHTFDVDYDPDDYAELLDAYLTDGEKVWITATVTIDGVTYEDAGLKLKGNSSLRGVSADSAPEDLPWVIRLDKFVEDQNHEGSTEFAVRANSTETSLNEAIALDLLDASGLAAEEAIAVAFTVEGSDATLRLVIENPNDEWMERELGDGYLYKAETGGDYSYRGDDESAYEDVFDQEGGEDNLEPLIDFLQFIDESDDATFAAELADHLDVDAFATYLAFQELVENDDDIDGAGNNSYLYYDIETALMTVVNWDLNLAYGASPAGTGGDMPGGIGGEMGGPGEMGGAPERGMGGPGELVAPDDATAATSATATATTASTTSTAVGDDPAVPPIEGGMGGPGETGEMPDRGGDMAGGGAGRGSNILSERFLANAEFAALVDAELERLTALFYESGLAEDALEDWVEMLQSDATDLVDSATIESEAASLASRFTS